MDFHEKINSKIVVTIFQNSVADWHKQEKPSTNPYPSGTLENTLYQKNQVDTIQWHIEDEIRRPDIPVDEIVKLKRSIDSLNQDRTDTVERLDDFVGDLFKNVQPKAGARLNSESPAWLMDRMSILELKIYHMLEQTQRQDASPTHIQNCKNKLDILLEQRQDLSVCLDELLTDLATGERRFKVYRQMKMYNDKSLNPSLYKNTTK
ncbi:DUF4254 domain-containing protein [Leptospira sp. GIMC2001]|uniref:DUF4254 domain-containing protein n=1 Tax=Leptospira sp. GIMC2001 TaxID=1513297 RepID=UPI0023492423|nr:DUF4254 domain-containing protein [Leptospira sp. GIMC2001]WCL50582.1 DUF4254 domain-containing protein [Leptospira sp. GIMC2001]